MQKKKNSYSEDALDSYFTNKVIASDGTESEGDFFEFAQIVDLFAAEYGLGGCRSLEEFADMMNETDPVLLSFLGKSMIKRHKDMWGEESEERPEVRQTKFGPQAVNRTRKYKPGQACDTSDDPEVNRRNLAVFLKEMGADRAKVNEAMKNIAAGKTSISSKSFTWITPEMLKDPEFNLKETLAEMREARAGAVNFNVNYETFRKRLRQRR